VAELLGSLGVTTLWLTAGLFHLMVETAPDGLARLRQLLAGGDVLSASHCRKALRALRGGTLINGYGPTENATFTTCHRMVDERDIGETVPIGRPIANSRIYVLDDHLQPVPIGVRGELWAAGDGVALGYWKDPQLTAAKFVPDPFSIVAGALMYRTGDFARYRTDGVVEFLGRIDNQVNIRGYRIEPGEVEALLMQHDGVKDAAVIVREDKPGDKRLVGYVVPKDGDLDFGEVRAYLKQSLPDYMLPSAFVPMQAIPLTANGKVDRRALPAPEYGGVGPEAQAVLARTYVEKRLSELWEEIFNLPSVSVRANFFELGGHSLLAVKLMAGISRVFGRQLPLNTLYASPTIEQLAKHIEDPESTDGRHALVSIQASGNRPPVYWIPGGAALGLFSHTHIVERLGPEQPIYGLGSAFPKTLSDIESVEVRAARYLELVRKVQAHGPYCFIGFCAGGIIAFEMAEQLLRDGEHTALVGMINCHFPRPTNGRLAALQFKSQRLGYHLRRARAEGKGLLTYLRGKVAAWRATRAKQQKITDGVQRAKRDGFVDTGDWNDRVVLDATLEVISQYQPAFYEGPISLFISEEDSLSGVSRDLDPRFVWARYAAAHDLYALKGGHEEVVKAPYVFELAEAIDTALHKALGRNEVAGPHDAC
jgi:thioesterase domain-containing protein/acyl carrier protein